MRRRFLMLCAGAVLAGCARPLSHRPIDALVGAAAAPGRRCFPTLAAALAAAPPGEAPYRIGIGAGVHLEKLRIERPNVYLLGAGRARSVLRGSDAAGMRGADGVPLGTDGSATLSVLAPGFRAEHLTIENAFDYVADLAAPRFERIGPNGAQGVALRIAAGADGAGLSHCVLLGHQDTLCIEAGRVRLDACTIAGSVDVVFGAGSALLDRCVLHSRYRPGKTRQGYLAAPSTPRRRRAGLVFHRCRLERDAAVPDASVALGRPWRPTREYADGRYGDPDAVGAAAFIDCWMDAHVDPAGWDAMAYTARDGGRVLLDPSEARLAEYASGGPGAHRHPQRPRLDPAAAVALLSAVRA